MKYAICAECGLVTEAELTHNGVCQVGLYHHCGWAHDCSPDELYNSRSNALLMAHEQSKEEKARAVIKEAESQGCTPKINGCWIVWEPPPATPVLMKMMKCQDEMFKIIKQRNDSE
jgi:hypothetical protein